MQTKNNDETDVYRKTQVRELNEMHKRRKIIPKETKKKTKREITN